MGKTTDITNGIIDKLNIAKLPFKIDSNNLNKFGVDIANELSSTLSTVNVCPTLKWCFSTIKKAKVFIIIYQANERGMDIYKEEIAKMLPEYSYKTIATIIDEGIEKNAYISLDPFKEGIRDKKIKNIRPSTKLVVSFLNWNIERISKASNLINKYK